MIPNEPPPDLRGLPSAGVDDVRRDDLPFGSDYGDVISDVEPTYQQGDRVAVTFHSGNPRLNHQVTLQADSLGSEFSRFSSGWDGAPRNQNFQIFNLKHFAVTGEARFLVAGSCLSQSKGCSWWNGHRKWVDGVLVLFTPLEVQIQTTCPQSTQKQPANPSPPGLPLQGGGWPAASNFCLFLQTGQSFLEVQRNDSGSWVVDKTDAYWETRSVVIG